LPQQQLAFVPVQFGREPALPCPFDDLQGIVVQQGHGLFDLPRDLACPSKQSGKLGHKYFRTNGAESVSDTIF